MINLSPTRWSGRMAVLGLAAGSLVGLSACGSSGHSNASSGSAAAAAPTTGGSASGGVTVAAASVPGYGTVLVDGKGRTLYMLTSEQGGKLTCTDDNGCTKYWPDTELPAGVTQATVGRGIHASLLGTIRNSAGNAYVDYGGWPLYTYSGDSAPGQAHGEGINSFGGTWYVIGVDGHPVTSKSQSSSQGGGGYGY